MTGPGCVGRKSLADALLALHQEIELGVKGGARLFVVEIGEKRIVFAIVNAPRVQTFRQNAGKGSLADPQRTFDHNELRWL